MDKNALMKKIQELSFAKDEAILFLDMHPSCTGAIQYFRDTVRALDEAMAEYQSKYGPIYHEAAPMDGWTWAEGAWPWQTEKMRGEK